MTKKFCNFCIAPFANLLVSPNGQTFMCPKNVTELGNTNNDLVQDIWDSKKLNQFREKFANDEKDPSCKNCWDVEKDGGKSLRQFSTEYFFAGNPDQSPETLIENWKNKKLKLVRFEFALSNACNLSCRHCWPISSTGLSAQKLRPAVESVMFGGPENNLDLFKANESFSDKTFDKSFSYVTNNTDQISIVGGEPFLDRRIMNFLESFSLERKQKVHLTITSNFSRPDIIKKSLHHLKEFKKIDIAVSIDGSPSVTEFIRNGSSVAKIRESIDLLKEHFGDKIGVERLILCNFALQAMNILDLPNAIKFIAGELGIVTITILHVHERQLNINILPFEIKQLAKQRLMDFIINDFESLINPTFHQLYYETIFEPVIKMCDSENRNIDGWNKFMEYTEKFDRGVDKNIFDVIPELKNYWFKI